MIAFVKIECVIFMLSCVSGALDDTVRNIYKIHFVALR